MPNLLVTGATGTVGRHTVAALLDLGRDDLHVRAASREPARVRELFGAGVQAVAFDYADADTYAAALAGVDAVMLIVPPVTMDVAALAAPFVDYLAAHGPQRVVHLSAYGADRLPVYAPLARQVRAADLRLTVLEPTFFASNFGTYEREGIEERGMIFQVSGDGRTAYVTPADVGRAAAAVLADGEEHVGHTYRLTGPEALDLYEVAAALSEVRGGEVRYVPATEEAYRGALASAGVPGLVAEYMLPLYALLREARVAEVSEDVERLTGKRPEPLRVQLARDFEV